MNINLIAVAVCLVSLPLVSASASPVEQPIRFKANIPEEDFTITPATPWPAEVIDLIYNAATHNVNTYIMEMSIVSKTYDVKAKLEKEPFLSHETDKNTDMLMNVQVDGAALNTHGRIVHTKSPFGQQHNLSIRPHSSVSLYPRGKYTGNMAIIFYVD